MGLEKGWRQVPPGHVASDPRLEVDANAVEDYRVEMKCLSPCLVEWRGWKSLSLLILGVEKTKT